MQLLCVIIIMVMKMRNLIISDIHGDYLVLKKILNKETFDRLIILGDLFSYGYDHHKDEIINLISKYKNKLLLIKGNCDYDIDFISLQFFETITIPLNHHLVTLTHGNIYHEGFLPTNHGDIMFFGHTHIPCLKKSYDITYANPGSVSLPRGGSFKSYMIFEDNKITLKSINGDILKEMNI